MVEQGPGIVAGALAGDAAGQVNRSGQSGIGPRDRGRQADRHQADRHADRQQAQADPAARRVQIGPATPPPRHATGPGAGARNG